MAGAGILDGDYVVVRQQAEALPGDIVAAGIPGGEATVKTYSRRGDDVVLLPANPKWPRWGSPLQTLLSTAKSSLCYGGCRPPSAPHSWSEHVASVRCRLAGAGVVLGGVYRQRRKAPQKFDPAFDADITSTPGHDQGISPLHRRLPATSPKLPVACGGHNHCERRLQVDFVASDHPLGPEVWRRRFGQDVLNTTSWSNSRGPLASGTATLERHLLQVLVAERPPAHTGKGQFPVQPDVGAGRVDIKTFELQHDGKIRGFLQFEGEHAGADGVGRPGRDQNRVAWTNGELVQQSEQRSRSCSATSRESSGCSTSRRQPT